MEDLKTYGNFQTQFPGLENRKLLIWIAESRGELKLVHKNMGQLTFRSNNKQNTKITNRILNSYEILT